MINRNQAKLLSKFNRGMIANEKRTYRASLKIFKMLYKEYLQIGVKTPPLKDMQTSIRIAKILNSL